MWIGENRKKIILGNKFALKFLKKLHKEVNAPINALPHDDYSSLGRSTENSERNCLPQSVFDLMFNI